MSLKSPVRSKKPGPRKDSSKYKAVLKATRELVDESGYRALSLKAISSRAGVTRNLLYNWWDGDLNRIVEEAILPSVADWKVPETGSLSTDLEQFIGMSIDAMHRPNVLGGYLELASHVVDKPEDLQRTSKSFRTPYARLLGRILQNAEARGELSKHDPENDIHHSILAQIISGCVLQFAISKKLGKRQTKKLILDMSIKLLQI